LDSGKKSLVSDDRA